MKFQPKIILLWSVVFIAFNIVLFTLAIPGRDYMDKLRAGIFGNAVGINIVAAVLGSFIALIPYKGLPYRDRFLRSSLFTILSIQLLFFIGLLFISFMRLRGWPG